MIIVVEEGLDWHPARNEMIRTASQKREVMHVIINYGEIPP
jgi:hypothetical protein